MAYDGLTAGAVALELAACLEGAKIEKVQQPESDEIILQLNTPAGRRKLLLCIAPQASRVQFTGLNYENPKEAPVFCMLLRKHIQGGRISRICQVETERIIRFYIETVNEMGYSVNKCLICENMGKHSNIVLIDSQTEKIIDSMKRISIDVNRYRQILPGLKYTAPPSQNKLDLWTLTEEALSTALDNTAAEDGAKALMSCVQGLSPAVAQQIAETPEDWYSQLDRIRKDIIENRLHPAVYSDSEGNSKDFHIIPMSSYAGSLNKTDYESTGACMDAFYSSRPDSNKLMQRCMDMTRTVQVLIDKQQTKKARLMDELLKSEQSEDLRIKAELLNANLHLVRPGADKVTLISYYDGSEVEIALDVRYSAAKNAQNYYKRYSKAKNAHKEKLIQLDECAEDIAYLQSVLGQIPGANGNEDLELLRRELMQQGYIRLRKASERNRKTSPKPRHFKTSTGYDVLVGRNNTENDYLTFKMGRKTDIWLHTKDIPGSHVLLQMNGDEADETTIFEAAAIAAWFSQAQESQNVPVDYVNIRYVKKPAGAKPGKVIFTNNRTVWTDPKDPNPQS